MTCAAQFATPDASRRLRAVPAALIAVGLLATCSGCATMMSGTTERIRIESEPPGAQVTVDGKTYTTPVDVTLPRGRSHEVAFELPAHEPARRTIRQETNGWTWGNVLIGGVIGVVVDEASGAAGDLEPDVVSVRLTPLPAAPPAPDESAGSGEAASAQGPPAPPPDAAPAAPPAARGSP